MRVVPESADSLYQQQEMQDREHIPRLVNSEIIKEGMPMSNWALSNKSRSTLPSAKMN
jgi:hypothetical protein